WGNAARDTFYDAANGISGLAHFFNELNHLVRDAGLRTANDIGLDVSSFHFGGVNIGNDVLDLLDVREDFNAIFFPQQFFGNSTGSNAPDGFARARAAATWPGADAEFRLVRVIRMRRPKFGFH